MECFFVVEVNVLKFFWMFGVYFLKINKKNKMLRKKIMENIYMYDIIFLKVYV